MISTIGQIFNKYSGLYEGLNLSVFNFNARRTELTPNFHRIYQSVDDIGKSFKEPI